MSRRDVKPGQPSLELDASSYGFGWAAHRTCDANDLVEAGLRDMLAREPAPGELEELGGYAKLHGTCSSFALARATSPTDATFALTCERGRFELQANLARGKLVGFSGISHGVAVPSVVTKLAGDAMSLINKWGDGLFARTFADSKGSGQLKGAGTQLHGSLGACRVGEIVHEAQGWGIDASCERGTAHFYIEEKQSKLTSFLIMRTEGGSPCAAQ